MKFRKKPIVIEAVQYDGTNYGEIISLSGELGLRQWFSRRPSGGLLVQTPEGIMQVNKGDWVIKGIKGELSPCQDAIFKETYEKVADE